MRSDFVKPLIIWYESHGRDLPWRRTKDPYRIWVSEIMLQQTRVEAVKGYYDRFLNALPDVYALADCPDDELNKLWEGLGYYSRARNMKKAAAAVRERYDGIIPNDPGELKKLPGIGDYTAGAIASIAFGKPEPAVDGNVIRVVSRLGALGSNFTSVKEKRALTESLRDLTLPDNADWGTLNQSFMDLGAGICLPNAVPECRSCPIANFCRAHQEGKEMEFPVRSAKKERKIHRMTVFLIRNGDALAIRKRPPKGLLSDLYEFPNTDGYLDEESAVSFAEEITGSEAVRIKKAPDARHVFSHVEWHMRGYEITVTPTGYTEVPESVLKNGSPGAVLYADVHEIERHYPIPSAFAVYARYLNMRVGKRANDALK